MLRKRIMINCIIPASDDETILDGAFIDTIYIDLSISNPNNRITGDINGKVIQWIRSNSHRVLGKKTEDGVITYAVLHDKNSNSYYNGTAAKTDGTEGDVFVKLPTFYYSGNHPNSDGSSGNNVEIKFSNLPFTDCVTWDGNTLIGAYEAYYYNNKLWSRSGVQSTGSTDYSNFTNYISNRGIGYQLVDWQMHCVLGCLFYAMYGSTDSLSVCGKGTGSNNKVCGETNILGMLDTDANTNGNTMSINFWGLENWWGNKEELMEGIKGGASSIVIINSPDPNGTRMFRWVYRAEGRYSRTFRFGKYLDLSRFDDTSENYSSYFCDENVGPNESGRVATRSGANSYTTGGVSFASCNYIPDYRYLYTGTRIAFRGTCVKESNITTFKNLPLL